MGNRYEGIKVIERRLEAWREEYAKRRKKATEALSTVLGLEKVIEERRKVTDHDEQ